MMRIKGYTLLQEDDLPSCQSVGRLFRHRSGAMVYHFANDDRENSFCFGFSTPVQDSKGTPHILEHTVLTGSKKFPLKEPFISLAKGSVNSFLNAATYPDKTVYPSASVVEADFFNLLDVYGDAVFFPLLRPECFAQEGHRLEFDEGGKLRRSGVVYNEMKGAFSSLDQCASEYAMRSLFDHHPYAYESGGDPAEIPALTYNEFCAFYRQHYRPQNCLLVVYGNIPPADVLSFVHRRFFDRFQDAEPDPVRVPLMEERKSLLRLRKVIPVPAEGEEQGVLFVSWLLPEARDSRMLYSLMVLEELLLGHDASPLRGALTGSTCGEAVSSYSGLMAHLRQPAFLCGLRGARERDLPAFVALVDQQLAQLVREGLNEELLRGALQRVEFKKREISPGIPQGLRLSSAVLRGWFYGQSPFDAVEFDQAFAWVKEQGSPYFVDLVRRLLLENPHRSELFVVSNREGEPWDERIPSELAPQAAEDIRQLNAQLERLQQEPDPPEALEQLKFLRRNEIPRHLAPLRGVFGQQGALSWSRHALFSRGIRYLQLGFDYSHLNLDGLALLPLFCDGITELGLPEKDYQQVLRELNLWSGRCFARPSSYPMVDGGEVRSLCSLVAAFLPQQRDQLFALVDRLLQAAHWDNRERVKQLLDTSASETREAVIPRGHSFAMLRARSHLSPLAAVEEVQRGLAQLRLLEKWRSSPLEELVGRMKGLRTRLGQVPLTVSEVGEGIDWEWGLRWAEKWAGENRAEKAGAGGFSPSSVKEGFVLPSEVGYTGVALPGVDYQHPLSAAMSVLAHCLSTDYLWEKVRMEGGAYGSGASQSGLGGHFSFFSYRDPKCERSLELFAEGLRQAKTHQSERVENAVVVLAGRELRPLTPSEEAGDALRFSQMGLTDEMRQQWRDRLLAVEPEQVHQAADLLLERWDRRSVCVLATERKLRGLELERIEQLPT